MATATFELPSIGRERVMAGSARYAVLTSQGLDPEDWQTTPPAGTWVTFLVPGITREQVTVGGWRYLQLIAAGEVPVEGPYTPPGEPFPQYDDSAARSLLQFPGKRWSEAAGGGLVEFWNTSGEAWDTWWTGQAYYDLSPANTDPAELARIFRGGIAVAGTRDAVAAAYNSMSVGTNSLWSAGVRLRNVTRVMFIVNANVTEVGEGQAYATDFAVEVNGQQVTERPMASGIYNIVGQASAVTITWDEPQAIADVRVTSRAGYQMVVANPECIIGLQTGGTVARPLPRLGILGDSWTEGKPVGGQLQGVVDMLCLYAGWDVAYNGQGGTGYVNPGPPENSAYAGPYGRKDRVDALVGYGPDAWCIIGSDNDLGTDPEQVRAAAAALYAELDSRLPGVPGVVIGCPSTDAADQGEAINSALAAAAAAAPNVAGFVDPLAEGWAVPAAMSPDGAHTNVQGSEHIATHVHAAVRDVLVRAGHQQW